MLYMYTNGEVREDDVHEFVIDALKIIARKHKIYVVVNVNDCLSYNHEDKSIKYLDEKLPSFYVHIEGYTSFFINAFGMNLNGAKLKRAASTKDKYPNPMAQLLNQIRWVKQEIKKARGKDVGLSIPNVGYCMGFYGSHVYDWEEVSTLFGIREIRFSPEMPEAIAQYIRETHLIESNMVQDDIYARDMFFGTSDIYCLAPFIEEDNNYIKEHIKNDDGSDRDDDFYYNLIKQEKETRISTSIILKDIHVNPAFRGREVNQIIAYLYSGGFGDTHISGPGSLYGKRIDYLVQIFPYNHEIAVDGDMNTVVNVIDDEPLRAFDDVIMPEIDRLNKANPFYIKPFEWRTKEERVREMFPEMLSMIIYGLVWEITNSTYGVDPEEYVGEECEIDDTIDWLFDEEFFIMNGIAHDIRKHLFNNLSVYKKFIDDPIKYIEGHNITDLNPLREIVKNIPKELLTQDFPCIKNDWDGRY